MLGLEKVEGGAILKHERKLVRVGPRSVSLSDVVVITFGLTRLNDVANDCDTVTSAADVDDQNRIEVAYDVATQKNTKRDTFNAF